GQFAVFANLPAHFKAAVTGDHDIEQEEYRRLLARLRQHIIAGRAKTDVESGQLQMVADQVGDVRIVFEDNDVLLHWNFFWLSHNDSNRKAQNAAAQGQP